MNKSMEGLSKKESKRLSHLCFFRYWPYIFITIFLFPIAVIFGKHIYAPCDDMYIFLVYARNFVEGNGLTYNGIFVEGFTSVLWVILLSVLSLTKIDLPILAESLSFLTGLFTLVATFKLAKSLQIDDVRLALIPPILLVATGDFTFYMAVGLEQVLFTGLVAFSVALSYSQNPGSLLHSFSYPLLLAIMILTRPEGMLIVALLLIMMLLRTHSPLSVFRCGIFLALFLVPILIAKWAYYGYWLPNTYFAKSNVGLLNLSQGLEYLAKSYVRYGVVVVFGIALVLWGFFNKKQGFLSKIWPLGLISIVWIIYVIVQGGDNMVGGRVFLPILPLIYVMLVKLAVSANVKLRSLAIWVVFISFSLVLGYFLDSHVAEQAQGWRDIFPKRQNVGLYLQENYPPETLVALNPAGIIPYFSQLPTIDMLGLNDIHIARNGKRDHTLRYGHQVGDGLYVLAKEPDIILFASGWKLPGAYISDQEIWNSQQFHEKYELQEWPGVGYAYVRQK